MLNSFNLGDAHGRVIISDNIADAVQAAEQEFRRGIGSITDSMRSFGDNVSQVGMSFTTAALPLKLFAATGIKAAGDFDQSMRMISARTGLVGDELEKVRQRALDLGADTVFSGQQAADAFLQLLTAGLEVNDALETLPNVLQAAAASGSDLGRSADFVTNIMSVFQIEAAESGRIIEALARSSASSNAQMHEVAEAMQAVGGLARNMGLSMEQTSAVMAIFANAGIRGAQAGTQLRSMLINMTADTASTREAWEALGTSMFDAQGNMRDFDEVLADIRRGLADKTPEEANRIIKDLAGTYGITGFNALLASEGIDAMLEKMDEQASAAEIAETMMGSWNNTINSLMGSIQTFQIEVLTPFINERLQPLARRLIDVVNAMTAWTKANPELTQTVVEALAVFVLIGPTLLAAGKAISVFATLLAALTSPIGLLVSLSAAFAFIWERNALGIQDTVIPIFNRLRADLARLRAAISVFIEDVRESGFIEAIKNAFGVGEDESWLESVLVSFGMAQETAENVVNVIVDVATRASNAISGMVNRLRPLFVELRQFVTTLLSNIDVSQVFEIGRTLLTLTNPVGQVMTVLRAFGVDFGEIIGQAIDAATRFFAAINDGAGVFDALRAAFGDSQVIDAIEHGFGQIVSFVTETVIPGLQQLADWFLNTVMPTVVGFIQGTVIPAVESLIGVLLRVWNDVSPFLNQLADWFLTTILPSVLDFIEQTVIPIIELWVDLLAGVWEKVSPALENMYDWFIQSALPAIMDFIEGPFTRVFQAVLDLLASIWDVIGPALGSVHEWFVENALPGIVDFLENTVKGAIDDFINLLNGIWGLVEGGLNALKNGIMFILGPIETFINNLTNAFNNLRRGVAGWEAAGQHAQTIQQGLASGQFNVFDVAGATINAVVQEVRGFQTGIDFVPEDGLAYLHRGERVVPATDNSLMNGGREQVVIESVVIHANDAEGGRKAAKAFSDELANWWRMVGD